MIGTSRKSNCKMFQMQKLLKDCQNGVKASAARYSLTETAKANNLKPYECFSYLLIQLMMYPRDDVPDNELAKRISWSTELPDRCRKIKNRKSLPSEREICFCGGRIICRIHIFGYQKFTPSISA